MIYKRTAAAVVVATMLLAASVAPALADPVFTKTEKEVKKVNKQEKKIAEKKWTHKRADAPKLRCSGGNKNELSILFEAGKDGSEKGHEVQWMLKEAYELNKNDPNPWKGACRAFFKNSLEEGEDVELDIGSSLASDWQLQSTYARCKAELMCGATYVFRAYTNKFTDIGDKVNFLRSEASDEITCKVKECNGQCANDNAYWLDRGLIKGWPVDFVVLGLRTYWRSNAMAIMSANKPNDLTKLGQALLAAKMSIYNGVKATSETFTDIAKADKLIRLLVVPPRETRNKRTSTDNLTGSSASVANTLVTSLAKFVRSRKCVENNVGDVCVDIPDKCFSDNSCNFLGGHSLKSCRKTPEYLPYKVCLRPTDATTTKPKIMEQWHSPVSSNVQCPATWIYVCVGNDHMCNKKVPLIAGTGGAESARRCDNSFCLPQYSVGAKIHSSRGRLRYALADGEPHFYPVIQQLMVDKDNACALRLSKNLRNGGRDDDDDKKGYGRRGDKDDDNGKH